MSRPRDNPSFLRCIARFIAAAGRRIGEGGDIEELRNLVALRGDIERAEHEAAARLLHTWNYSYGDVARALGITRQAAHARYARKGTRHG